MEKNMKNNTDTIQITESLAACQRVTHSDSAVLQLKKKFLKSFVMFHEVSCSFILRSNAWQGKLLRS